MNIYTLLKLIGLVSMILDHFGLVLHISWMRVLGRFAMPIFAYLMGYGTRITKHEGTRVIKLGITAAISVPLTMITFENRTPNIMVQFFLFALVMWLLRKFKVDDEKWQTVTEITAILSLSLIAQIGGFDYAWELPILCYIAYKWDNMLTVLLSYAIIFIIYPITKSGFSTNISVNTFAIGAIPLLLWFMDKKDTLTGRKIYRSKIITWLSRNFFYVMYPLHVAIILILKIIFAW